MQKKKKQRDLSIFVFVLVVVCVGCMFCVCPRLLFFVCAPSDGRHAKRKGRAERRPNPPNGATGA